MSVYLYKHFFFKWLSDVIPAYLVLSAFSFSLSSVKPAFVR